MHLRLLACALLLCGTRSFVAIALIAAAQPPTRAAAGLSDDGAPAVDWEILGSGSIDVDYQPGATPGQRVATLSATPSEGWQFIEWTGAARSREPHLELRIERDESLVAHFGRIIDFGETRWEFLPSDEVVFAESPGGPGAPLLRISTDEPAVGVRTRVYALSKGVLEAAARWVTDGQPPPDFSPLELRLEGVGSATSLAVRALPYVVETNVQLTSSIAWELGSVSSGDGKDASQIDLSVLAPDGRVEISPAKASYAKGDVVNLSVKAPFREEFLGWRGDAFSSAYELALVLEEDATVQAVFERPIAVSASDVGAVRGLSFWNPAASSGIAAFASEPIEPGAWTELDLGYEAPLTVGIRPSGVSGGALSVSVWQGGEKLQSIDLKGELYDYYIDLDPARAGTFRVLVENKGATPGSLSIEVFALYQRVLGGTLHSETLFAPGGTVLIEPSPFIGLVEVGQTVALTPSPSSGFEFKGWRSPSVSSGNKYTVRRDEAVEVSPIFATDFGDSALSLHPDSVVFWDVVPGPAFGMKAGLSRTSPATFALHATGPGVVSLTIDGLHDFDGNLIAEASATVDGEPVLITNQNVGSNIRRIETTVDSGAHVVAFALRLADGAEGLVLGANPRISNVAITPGYRVAPLYPQGNLFTVTPSAPDGIYAKGQTVTVAARVDPGASFLGWEGGFSGYPASFDFVVDRHALANPRVRPATAFGGATASFSSNVLATRTGSDLYFNNGAGPAYAVFDVPALTELSFEGYASATPIRVSVNGETVFEGLPQRERFGFPVKEEPFAVRVDFDFDPAISDQVQITGIQALASFDLVGDFGEASQYVTATPMKDRYLPGEVVTIGLAPDAPADLVFFDLFSHLPNLGWQEWLPDEFTRSFEVEVVSDTVVAGRLAPKPTRSPGSLSSSAGLSFANASGAGRFGGDARRGAFLPHQIEYFRIYAGAADSITFWAQIPSNQAWLIHGGEASAPPLAVLGDGSWRKFSLPVPSGLDYFTVECYADSSTGERERFLLSDIEPRAGYLVSYVSSGDGQIAETPSSGSASPGAPVSLTAAPGAGSSFLSWGAGDAGLQNPRTFATGGAPIFPAFLRPVEDGLNFEGHRFAIEGAAPQVATKTIQGASEQAIVFGADSDAEEGLSLQLAGPARVRYRMIIGNGAELYVSVDGQKPNRHLKNSESTGPYDGELIVPAGEHALRFEFGRWDSAGTIDLYDLQIERGGVATIVSSQSGSLAVSPAKNFYPLGESVTVTAQPQPGWVFDGWKGALAGKPASVTFAVDDHFRLEPQFKYKATLDDGDVVWQAEQISAFVERYTARAILEGPGLLSVSVPHYPATSVETYLDRAPAETYFFGGRLHLPIPPGKHEVMQKRGDSVQWLSLQSTFTPGYAVILQGDTRRARLDPERDTYALGDTPKLSWAANYQPSAQERIVVNGQDVTDQMPLALHVSGHLILRIRNSVPIDGTGFATSSDSSEASPIATALRYTAEPSFELGGPLAGKYALRKRYDEGGSLSFRVGAFDNLQSLTLVIDERPALALAPGQSYQIALPSQGALVEWILEKLSASGGAPATQILDISFSPAASDALARYLGEHAPAHVYATSQALGPDDDLDGDGFANHAELVARLDPYQFDIPTAALLRPVAGAPRPFLRFTLPGDVDLGRIRVQLYSRNDDSPWLRWTDHALADLDHERTTTASARAEYLLPLEQFSIPVALARVAVTPAEDTD